MEKCGCKIISATASMPPGEIIPAHIEYCPLHAAAGELLEYAKRYHDTLQDVGHTTRPNCCKFSKLISRAAPQTGKEK